MNNIIRSLVTTQSALGKSINEKLYELETNLRESITTGSLTTENNATIGGTLSAAGNSTFANLSSSGITNSGNQTVAGTLSVTGNSTMNNLSSSSLTVSGEATLSSNLTMNGNFNFNAHNLIININAPFSFNLYSGYTDTAIAVIKNVTESSVNITIDSSNNISTIAPSATQIFLKTSQYQFTRIL